MDDLGLVARLLVCGATSFAPADDALPETEAVHQLFGRCLGVHVVPRCADCDLQCQEHCGDPPRRILAPWYTAEI